ncbi:SPT3 Dosage dependent suppressor of Ty-induced promoter mutations-like protein [Mortierella polycephala]|uniref:SPT3 Dosage dependent suppressor of Ty-induced promoter mutations-like protein n=1 Tax=Mortierella polycephala TaxID=41804 RepID=A0A9P6PVR2_9FUNG|nr:SPT3 Dosage dependent suppressor of Ty-induced promoter mutations-like protein [Mortierella polycephala]
MRPATTPQQPKQQYSQFQQMQHQNQIPLQSHQSIVQQQQQQQQQHQQQPLQNLSSRHNIRESPTFASAISGPYTDQQAYPTYTTTRNDIDQSPPMLQHHQQYPGNQVFTQQQQQQQQQHLPSAFMLNQSGQRLPPQQIRQAAPSSQRHQHQQQHQQQQQVTPGKQKSTSHYGQRYHPMYPSPPSSSTTPVLSNASLSPVTSTIGTSQTSGVNTLATSMANTSAAESAVTAASLAARQSLTPQVSPHMGTNSETLTPSWSPAYASASPSSTASMPSYLDNYETPFVSGPGADLAISTPLTVNNLYARSLHTPFYQMDIAMANGYGSQGPDVTLLGTAMTVAPGDPLSQSLSLSHSRLPAFDVKAYTFRKKPRHYVAVKHKNALRIEPIIYLKTSILDKNRQVVRNWDYLRFKLDRFRENAQPKKKLNPEELRGARILDVDIVLVSPNNRDRVIEDSCPACVMRMDGERRIMQVLAKNFKQSPTGEPLIDIRKGHAIVCIKLNCYCDHHNEQEGFVVRLQTTPEVVRLGGSVKLRICCEARSKNGNVEQDAEEEDGLTDIDAPVSTGSRSPAMGANEQMLQSPSLSHESASPLVKSHHRTPSTSSSSMGSPRSMDERVVNSLPVENSGTGMSMNNGNGVYNGANGVSGTHGTMNGRVIAPPKFRQIYPLTPSEGTILGGTRVTIHGAHFDILQNPVVFFGKVPAELVTISHHDVMECTTPPAENLKPGIVPVKIASLAFPLGVDTASVDFLYMAPPDYDFCNLAATSLSYGMANEYPQDNSLAFILGAHGAGAGLSLGLLDDATSFISSDFDVGLAWSISGKEDMALEFLKIIQLLAPGRILPSFKSDSGHTMLHLAVQHGYTRLVRKLLDMGIDHTAMDRNSKTALHFARMLNNDEIIRMLTEARIPPRPMVPRMEASNRSNTNKELVATLIQKYEEDLVKVVRQEQYRKRQLLREMSKRAEYAMDARNQTADSGASTSESMTNPQASSRRESGPQRLDHHHQHTVDDTEEDDIMEEEMSNPSSPECDRLQDEEMSWNGELKAQDDAETERKHKAEEAPEGAQDATRKLVRGVQQQQRQQQQPPSSLEKPDSLTSAQLRYIQDGVGRWEGSKSKEWFGQTAELSQMTGLQTWICDNWSVSSLRESSALLVPLSSDNILHVMAVTATGLHHFTEQQSTSHSATIRRLEHWSLVEIEKMDRVAEDITESVCIEMCGLVSRGGRDLLGERLQFKMSKEDVTSFVNVVSKAHDGLMRYLDFRPKFTAMSSGDESQQLQQPFQPSYHHAQQKKSDVWIGSILRLWSKLFNAGNRVLDSVDYSVHDSTFTLKPAKDGQKAYSIFIMGAIMRTLREFDQCCKIRFEGVQVLEDGWKKPELVKELERMVQELRQIDRWNFADCGWASETAQGFLRGLGQSPNQDREPCRRISLAGNDFGGEDSVGESLARSLEGWRSFKTLDLTDCNIGLVGMEALVGKLENMFTIRLQGNMADHRWWQWVDRLLEMNPTLQKCRLGAPIAPAEKDKSLIREATLMKLQDLTALDLSTALINNATINILDRFVATHRELRTLTLARCQLDWSSVMPLFTTLCRVNESTKFTLDVSENLLFENEGSIQDWVQGIERSDMKVSGEPFGIKMHGLIVRNDVLRRVLEPMKQATCFNELDIKGLLIMRETQTAELSGLGYQEMCNRVQPDIASKETCEMLGQVIALNTTLVMLDISGTVKVDQVVEEQGPTSSSLISGGNRRTAATSGRSTGGFGRTVSLAFPTLAKNNTLRMLTMDNNRFGEEGMHKLAEALKVNTSLGVLSCDGNDAFTLKALKEVEKILPPFRPEQLLLKSVPSPATFQGTLEEAQEAGYNSTLSIWHINTAEILMHQALLTMEVERQLADFGRIERMEARRRELEGKFGLNAGGESGVGNGDTLLAEVKERHEAATRDRFLYADTCARIVGAVEANNRRSLEADERLYQQSQQ